MKLQVELEVDAATTNMLVLVAISRGYRRRDPKREWTEQERTAAVSFAATKLLSEALENGRFP
jgi:hypothetical protein